MKTGREVGAIFSQNENISDTMNNNLEFLQIVSDLSGIPASLWLTGRADEFAWKSRTSSRSLCPDDDKLRLELENYLRKDTPGIYFEDTDDMFFYGLIPVSDFMIALGPAAIGSAPGNRLREENEKQTADAEKLTAKTDIASMSLYMKLICCHFMGTAALYEEFPISFKGLDEWQSSGDLENYQLDQSENERTYQIGADFENTFLQMVENGDTASLKALLSGPVPAAEEIGELDLARRKETEYMAVSTITLLTRAAIAGGLPVETAHELGAVYLSRLGRAVSRGDSISGLSYGAMIEFSEAVRYTKDLKSMHSYVEACKRYIEKNFRKKLEVGEIAPAIGISRTYLSRLFRQSEGITIQQYIQKVKCRHAAQMLQYSSYSISEIAQYNGFSSQSYFGSCFLTWYGVTPHAYRKTHQSDFVHD